VATAVTAPATSSFIYIIYDLVSNSRLCVCSTLFFTTSHRVPSWRRPPS
jgi:hypothetical protein